ncbi:cuticular protein 76Bb [Cochliomyia hominivorax]
MRFLSVCVVILMVATVAWASYGHGGGSSYTVVTKHDAPIIKYLGGHHYNDGDHIALSGGAGHHLAGGVGLGVAGLYGGHLDKGLGHGYALYDKYDYHHKYPKYQFDYGVKDLKTGDIKNQWEHRDGGLVKGGYSLKESDGTTRVVEYSADDHNGFNAVVKKIGHAHHPEIYAKPILSGYAHVNALDHGGLYGHGHGHGYGHGHATSYVNVKQL